MFDASILVLKDSSSPASVLLAAIFDHYGTECFDWNPDILVTEIRDDFNITLSPIQSDKLQAAIIVMSTNQFENDWHVFNSCVHGLNGEPFDYDVFSPIDPEQIIAALPEIQTIRTGFMGDEVIFSDEVNAYAGIIFSEYGLISAPNEFPSAIMPDITTEHYLDSQSEKQAALAEIYTNKKQKIEEYLSKFK
jgi:hypothetical protein